jgi:hypothetical protein
MDDEQLAWWIATLTECRDGRHARRPTLVQLVGVLRELLACRAELARLRADAAPTVAGDS